MNTKKIFFSIIIPVKSENDFLRETRQKLSIQTFKDFELLVITDKISTNPCTKRNYGAKIAKGNYLCFIDDDSYPDKNWLLNVKKQIDLHSDYAAFCGPALTPAHDNILQQASGHVWSSIMGSGGAGVYRSNISSPRFVNDYPTVNFIVKKSVFNKIGGFKIKYWPGEDTIFCLDLVNIQEKIYYHPSIVVYHHRREILKEHLKQTNRYAIHRGHFARIFPQNSLTAGYLIPSAFALYFVSLPFHQIVYPLYLYIFLLFLTLINIIFKTKNILLGFLSVFAIFITHLTYGILFIKGYFSVDIVLTLR
ncbi:MAG: glycosyltransferase [Candidatus Shapirobacteria bacterium]